MSMKKHPIGTTGLEVTEIGLGTAPLGEMPDTYGYSVDDATALQFSLQDPRIASTVVGVSKPERVAQTLGWAGQNIPLAAWTELMALPYAAEDPEADRVYRPG